MMEKIIATAPSAQPSPTSTEAYAPVSPKRRFNWKLLSIVLVVVTIVVVVAITYFMKKRTDPTTPQEVINALEQVSMPIVIDATARTVQLEALSEKSAPVDMTIEERMDLFTMLEQ
mgnify:CR=1 FL=1